MVIMVIEVHVKPEMRDQFLEAITDDATHSEQDEPGCLRFDVLQDSEDEYKYYYYEVYKDEAARLYHRQTPHYARYDAVQASFWDQPVVRHMTTNVVPNDAGWR